MTRLNNWVPKFILTGPEYNNSISKYSIFYFLMTFAEFAKQE